MAIVDPKYIRKFSSCNFFFNFLTIKTLDSELDPNPDPNPDPNMDPDPH